MARLLFNGGVAIQGRPVRVVIPEVAALFRGLGEESMALIEVDRVSKDFGGNQILHEVTLAIEPGKKIGLIGRNGSGKSTLLRIISGEDDDFKGTVRRAAGCRIAVVSQQLPLFEDTETAVEFMCRSVIEARTQLDVLTDAMSDADRTGPEGIDPIMRRYSALRERYDTLDGDRAEEHAERLLSRLGLGDRAHAPAINFSGGEKNLLAIASGIRIMPDVLILDEPGNHLDLAGLAWLETFIRELPCAVLLVSHDRRMLDSVIDSVVELESGKATTFNGTYSAWRLEKLQRSAGQGQSWQADRKRLERLEALVRRFADIARARPDPAWGKRLRARRAQLGRAREESVDRPDTEGRAVRLSFDSASSKSDFALKVEGYAKKYGSQTIIESSSFSIINGERVALVGPNGCGKTSLLRDIVVQGSWDDRVLRVGPSMRIGYCSQTQDSINNAGTVCDAFLDLLPGRKEVQSVLGAFGFSHDDLDKRVDSLSGGELNRLQLARASALKANFLVLDEPTNHLDIQTRESVEDALMDFGGTILVVSHDRYFLEKVAERVVFVDRKFIHEYEGSFAEYWRDVGSRTACDMARAITIGDRAVKARSGASAGTSAGLEARIESMEKEKVELERVASEAVRNKDYARASAVATKLASLDKRLDDAWRRLID